MFHLRKWYFDAVSPQGRVAIAYAAWLRMGPFHWRYSALLLHDERRPSTSPITSSKFGEAPEPQVLADAVRWSCASLAFAGTWRAAQRGPTLTLYPGVEWSCLMPRADARLEVAGETWQGLGYVECIDMRIPPWRLPIDELRWGRWIGDKFSLVWIEWRGGDTRRWMLHNAAPISCQDLDDSGARAEGSGLTLARTATLRDGELGPTVLQAAPCLRRLAPARMVQARETKWLSQGMLRTPSDREDRGWAIHEVVKFTGERPR